MDRDFILRTAIAQSAVDCACAPEDFLRGENVAVESVPMPGARVYLKLPHLCHLVSYGSNIVVSARREFLPAAKEYVGAHGLYDRFETPALHRLDELFAPHGAKVCFMAEYFLPVPEKVTAHPSPLPLRLLTPPDFEGLYLPQWSNALCAARPQYDVLGVGAYDGGQLVGFAACSADCETMRQIGIDVLPAYRRRGIAKALVSRLTLEIMERGKVPFYCAAWSNLRSVRTALACGFVPSWVEVSVKEDAFVRSMNEALRD